MVLPFWICVKKNVVATIVVGASMVWLVCVCQYHLLSASLFPTLVNWMPGKRTNNLVTWQPCVPTGKPISMLSIFLGCWVLLTSFEISNELVVVVVVVAVVAVIVMWWWLQGGRSNCGPCLMLQFNKFGDRGSLWICIQNNWFEFSVRILN